MCPFIYDIILFMYNQFYTLTESPFNITSDPSFFFPSSRHEEAFTHLIYGIESRKGILVITGEIGTGKTTLCRALLNKLDDHTKTALILNPSFSELQLLQMIVKDLGIYVRKNNKLELVEAINKFLLEQSARGNNVAIVIDESQNLNIRQLEQIRLLSNLETEKEKLLQIILVGQPELLDKLNNQALRQLNQRVTVRYHILPLKLEEVGAYINHRLTTAGADKRLTFTDAAIKAVYENSGGTPRLINILCDRALLAGFVQESYTITDTIISQCAMEVK